MQTISLSLRTYSLPSTKPGEAQRLPETLRRIETTDPPYRVELSPGLAAETERLSLRL